MSTSNKKRTTVSGEESETSSAGKVQSASRLRVPLSTAEAGAERLTRLCTACGLESQIDRVFDTFSRLVAPWGDKVIGEHRWPSEVGDDHTPYEFSVAFGDATPELRLLVEPLGSPPSLLANRARALAVVKDLSRDHPVSMKRLHAVQDLFLPDEPKGLFSVWLGAVFAADGPTQLKIYLNPEAQGCARAAALIEEAMVRLGFNHAWPILTSSILRRGRNLDELKYFSLDLASTESARVKVYVRHLDATISALEEAARPAAWHHPGEIAEFTQAMGAPAEGPLPGRPAATCLSFVQGVEGPLAATQHFPVNGGYAENDQQVSERIVAYMQAKGLPVADYQRTIEAVAPRPLEAGIGIHSYASFRRERDRIRLTVYYPPEIYSPGTVASASMRPPPSTPAEIVERFEQEPITDHPFMRRLRREPVDLHKLWKLMANAQIGIVAGFSRRLAQVVAKVEDDRMRSILARQLNDELGGGDFERAHSQLFAKLVAGLAPWKPARVDDALLAPGHMLSERLESIYYSPDGMEGVGAAMVIEIFGRQVDQFTGDEFRRQKQVDPSTLEWLNLHEELEIDHSAESLELAHLVPAAALPAVWRGAERVHQASTAFFDAVYAVCFE